MKFELLTINLALLKEHQQFNNNDNIIAYLKKKSLKVKICS